MAEVKNTPIFIIAKDRRSYLQALINRLFSDGLRNLIVIDTGSTYPPMVHYLNLLRKVFRVRVVEAKPKGPPHRVLWDNDLITATGCRAKRFVLTDCDVVPDAMCPPDWLERLDALLSKHNVIKVGLGLRIDNLPDHYKKKSQVLEWEAKWFQKVIEPGVYSADVDTTLALYKPDEHAMAPALRTAEPYVAQHLPWYEDSRNVQEDIRHYRHHYDRRTGQWM
jgi:hypothetical protein